MCEVQKDASVEMSKDVRWSRDSQDDSHTAIDLAYSFLNAIKEFHPHASRIAKQIIQDSFFV